MHACLTQDCRLLFLLVGVDLVVVFFVIVVARCYCCPLCLFLFSVSFCKPNVFILIPNPLYRSFGYPVGQIHGQHDANPATSGPNHVPIQWQSGMRGWDKVSILPGLLDGRRITGIQLRSPLHLLRHSLLAGDPAGLLWTRLQ